MANISISNVSNGQLAVLLASALWGITSLQAVIYYRNFKSDIILMKIVVGIVWLANTMYVMLSAIVLYEVIRGNLILWLTPAVVTFAALMQSVVQMVYAFRLYNLSNQLWIPLICCTGAIYEFVALVLYAIFVLNEDFVENQIYYRWVIISTYIVCPIVDTIITATFCYRLKKDRQYIRQRTARILDKLVLWTIQSGLITSLLAIAIVIMDFTIPATGPFLILVGIIWPLYPVTLLALLHGRSELRSMDEKSDGEITSFNFRVHTQGELHPIPFNVPIGQQAAYGSNTASTIPETAIKTEV